MSGPAQMSGLARPVPGGANSTAILSPDVVEIRRDGGLLARDAITSSSILLIDDDADALEELREGLAATGATVFALTKADRLDEAAFNIFDIVICDLAMPGADGFEVIQQLGKVAKPPDLIIVSGYPSDIIHSAVLAATNAGVPVRAALSKPVNLDELVAVICNHATAVRVRTDVAGGQSEAAVRRTIAESVRLDRFPAMYQPKIRITDNALAGFEVLLCPDIAGLGAVTIPIQISAIEGDAALARMFVENQLSHAVALANGLPGALGLLRVNVNVPAMLLLDAEFIIIMLSRANTYCNDRVQVVVELTENNIPDNDGVAQAALGRLRLAGYGVALDDIGQKESGLIQFSNLPVTEIKIDAEFVKQARIWSKAREIIRSITEMSHRVGVSVTCEGIETEADVILARSAGVDYVQGFFYAPKLTAAALVEFAELNRRQRNPGFDHDRS